jgi:hypothetical protein
MDLGHAIGELERVVPLGLVVGIAGGLSTCGRDEEGEEGEGDACHDARI